MFGDQEFCIKDLGVWTGECVHKYKFICLMNAKLMVIKGPRFARTFCENTTFGATEDGASIFFQNLSAIVT